MSPQILQNLTLGLPPFRISPALLATDLNTPFSTGSGAWLGTYGPHQAPGTEPGTREGTSPDHWPPDHPGLVVVPIVPTQGHSNSHNLCQPHPSPLPKRGHPGRMPTSPDMWSQGQIQTTASACGLKGSGSKAGDQAKAGIAVLLPHCHLAVRQVMGYNSGADAPGAIMGS